MPVRLTAHIPGEAAAVRLVDGEGPIVLGRADDATLPLPHASVSRRHAELMREAGAWHLRDLGSKNGTRIEGRRIEREALADGQWFSVGDVFCEFATLDEAQATHWREREGQRRQTSRLLAERVEAAADPETLAAELIRAIVALTDCRRGFLLTGAGAADFKVRASVGIEPGELAQGRFGGSSGALERAVRERRPVFLSQSQDQAWLRGRPSVVGQGLRAIAAVPLEHQGRLLGVAYADSDDPAKLFTELDAELLEAFARRAALLLAAGALGEALARMERYLALAEDGRVERAAAPAWQAALASPTPT